jgi:hypothetical protein
MKRSTRNADAAAQALGRTAPAAAATPILAATPAARAAPAMPVSRASSALALPRGGLLTALAVPLAALASCAANPTDNSIVRLSGHEIITISPKHMSRYTCEPYTLVCESISGGGRFASRQCTCANRGPPEPK